jgi:hypothetical protein
MAWSISTCSKIPTRRYPVSNNDLRLDPHIIWTIHQLVTLYGADKIIAAIHDIERQTDARNSSVRPVARRRRDRTVAATKA